MFIGLFVLGGHTRIDHTLKFRPFANRSTVLLDSSTCVQQGLTTGLGTELVQLVGEQSGVTGECQLPQLAKSVWLYQLKCSLREECWTRDGSPEGCKAVTADVTVDRWNGVVNHALRVSKLNHTGKKDNGQEEDIKHDCKLLPGQLQDESSRDKGGNAWLLCLSGALISSTRGSS